MATFLLRTAFHNHPQGDSLLLAGRVYPLATTMKAGDWLVFGKIKILVREVEVSAYEGVILTIDQGSQESLKRTGIVLADLYGTEIQIESAGQ
ncbi:MAG: hypothetical protein EOO58_04785 [Hymenobacter sp.]|nr:MAG: hypothetical protein EOO58_04785 [Hymenobacter sp.]